MLIIAYIIASLGTAVFFVNLAYGGNRFLHRFSRVEQFETGFIALLFGIFWPVTILVSILVVLIENPRPH